MPNENARIRIRNFKCLEDIEIELKPLTLLFGPNGSGKSSFIKALMFFSKNIFNSNANTIFNIDSELDLNNYHDIVTNNNVDKSIIFEYTKGNDNYNLRFEFTNSNSNRCYSGITFEDLKNKIWCKFKLNQYADEERVHLYSYEDRTIKKEFKDIDEVSTIDGALFDFILLYFIDSKVLGIHGTDLESCIESLHGDMIDNNWADRDIDSLINRANELQIHFNEKAKKVSLEVFRI